MKKVTRIAIADDHKLFRDTLARYLLVDNSFQINLLAGNGSELIANLRKNKIDVILLDIRMPVLNGWQTLKILNERFPEIKVIMLSMYESDSLIVEGIKLGARSFLCKDCDPETLVDAIYTVAEEGYYFDSQIAKALRNKVVSRDFPDLTIPYEKLSSREIEIVQLICAGKTNREIAELLFKSVRTVEAHRTTISAKTNCKNVASLVVYAISNGLFAINS